MLTFDEANQLFRYDPDTGLVFWRIVTRNRSKGATEMTTREQIIAAANESGLIAYGAPLERFYAIAFEAGRVAEREACRKECGNWQLASSAADAIRARGDTK